MENQAGNTSEQTQAGQTQSRSMPLRPQKASQASSDKEGMLQQLLVTTETSASRIQSSIRKWQFLSLVLSMLVIPAVILIVWLSADSNAAREQRGRLETENQSLKNQINTANAQIDGAKNEVETLLNRNIELVQENAKLKSKNNPTAANAPIATVKTEQKAGQPIPDETKIVANATPDLDEGRIDKIRKGKYPSGTTRAELVAVLGEPNRIYTNRGYEQLVYFGRKPGRFWFVGNWLVQTTE
jgi:regulator of replication initiation timing